MDSAIHSGDCSGRVNIHACTHSQALESYAHIEQHHPTTTFHGILNILTKLPTSPTSHREAAEAIFGQCSFVFGCYLVSTYLVSLPYSLYNLTPYFFPPLHDSGSSIGNSSLAILLQDALYDIKDANHFLVFFVNCIIHYHDCQCHCDPQQVMSIQKFQGFQPDC